MGVKESIFKNCLRLFAIKKRKIKKRRFEKKTKFVIFCKSLKKVFFIL